MREGWICPKCKKILSPDVNSCDCSVKDILPFEPIPYVPPHPRPRPRPYYPDWTWRPYRDMITVTI